MAVFNLHESLGRPSSKQGLNLLWLSLLFGKKKLIAFLLLLMKKA